MSTARPDVTTELLIAVVLAVGATVLCLMAPKLLNRLRELRRASQEEPRLGLVHILVWVGVSGVWLMRTRLMTLGIARSGFENSLWDYLIGPAVGAALGGLLLWASRRWRGMAFPVHPGEFVLVLCGAIDAGWVLDLLGLHWALHFGAFRLSTVAIVTCVCVCLWAAWRTPGLIWKVFFVFCVVESIWGFLGTYPLGGWTTLESRSWFLPALQFLRLAPRVLLFPAIALDLGPGRRLPWTHWLGIGLFLYREAIAAWLCQLYSLNTEHLPVADVSCGLIVALLALVQAARSRPADPGRQDRRAVTPWYWFGIMAIWFVRLTVVDWSRYVPNGGVAFTLFAAALTVWALVNMAWAWYQQRPQFSLKSLHLIIVAVAVACSVAYYISVMPLITILGWILIAWTGLRNDGVATNAVPDTECPLSKNQIGG